MKAAWIRRMPASAHAFWKYAALALLGAAACSEAEDPGACPPDSDAQQLAGRQVVAERCLDCHASDKTGDARNGAPEGVNFDDLAVVRAQANEMYGRAKSGSMPPDGPAVTGAELEALRVWLACGAPDVEGAGRGGGS